jgi:hypothetical protein
MSEWLHDWVPFAAWGTALLALIVTVLGKSPLVPSSRVRTLRQTIADQDTKIDRMTAAFDRLTAENSRLNSRVDELLGECDYWRRKYQESDRLRERGGE